MQRKRSSYFKDSEYISVVRMKSQDSLNLHGHEFYELVIVYSGTGIHSTDDEEYEISAGDVFLVKPGHAHGYKDTNELEIVNVLYFSDLIKVPLIDLKNIPGYHAFFVLEPKMRRQHNFKSRLNLVPEELEKAWKLVQSIEKEIKSDVPGKDYMATSYFMQLQCFLARNYSALKSPEGKIVIGMADTIAFIEKKYQKPFTLGELAKIANMSKSTLHRNFLQATGFSPVKYLIRLRIIKAAELLRSSSLNVTEVAFAVGFNDSNYFVRQFRRIMGITPKQYRKKYI